MVNKKTNELSQTAHLSQSRIAQIESGAGTSKVTFDLRVPTACRHGLRRLYCGVDKKRNGVPFALTNIQEIFDQILLRLVGRPIPQPIGRLLIELMHGGAERIQLAANTHMINGEMSTIADTLEHLRTGAQVADQDLYLAVMKLWDLDGGVIYAVQRSAEEFTAEEKAYFATLDPDSPLTLPSRRYSEKEVGLFRSTYRGVPLSRLTTDQVDQVCASAHRWIFVPHDTTEAIKARYPNQQFANLSVAQIDTVLHEMGRRGLLEIAQNLRRGVRARSAKGVPASLATTENQLVSRDSHPVALALSTSFDWSGHTNVATQLPGFRVATNRIEAALARMGNHSSPDYIANVELYRTYTNMGLYSPHDLDSAKGIYHALVVATVEHGTTEDRADLTAFIHGKHKRLRDLLDRAHHLQGERFRGTAQALFNFIEAREKWDRTTLHFVLRSLHHLASVPDPDRFDRVESDQLLQRITELRRSVEINDESLRMALRPSIEADRAIRFGALQFSIETSANGQEKIASLSDLRLSEEDYSEFLYQLGKLEEKLLLLGFTGYQIVRPRFHVLKLLDSQAGYQETKLNDPRDQDLVGEPTILFKRLQPSAIDTTELRLALKSRRLEPNVRVGNFNIFLRLAGFNAYSEKSGKAMIIESITSDAKGSGEYASTLSVMAQVAREEGYAVMVIDITTDPRQWAFYERNGFLKSDRAKDPSRIYFREL